MKTMEQMLSEKMRKSREQTQAQKQEFETVEQSRIQSIKNKLLESDAETARILKEAEKYERDKANSMLEKKAREQLEQERARAQRILFVQRQERLMAEFLEEFKGNIFYLKVNLIKLTRVDRAQEMYHFFEFELINQASRKGIVFELEEDKEELRETCLDMLEAKITNEKDRGVKERFFNTRRLYFDNFAFNIEDIDTRFKCFQFKIDDE